MAPTTKKCFSLLFAFTLIIPQLYSQPHSRRADITVRQLAIAGYYTVRIKHDPASGRLYIVEIDGTIQRVNLGANGTATLTTVYTTANHGLNAPLGITFGQDGTMYLTGNDSTGIIGTATVVKGVPVSPGSETRTWSVIARTVGYPYGNIYNHRVNAIILNPTGDSLYINSGAATDHGEAHSGYREVGLTACIWKLPIDGNNIVLQDDRAWLRANGYIFAEGLRNTFDLAYAGNGDLFGPENSGDRDDPEELNWIRYGHHYGFPWRIGGNNTPQQYYPYNPHTDPLLSPNAWGGGSLYTTFSNDSLYPSRPDSIVFTEPIPNVGPDLDRFRDTTTGAVKDASALGDTITSFTPHLSIDGLVFDRDSILAGDLKGAGLAIGFSNSSLITALGDTGQCLFAISLTKTNGNYLAHVTKLVTGFNSPLGLEMVGDTVYVAETGLQNSNFSPKLWQIILPTGTVAGVEKNANPASNYSLGQNYPNPFNPGSTIQFQTPSAGLVVIKVYDILGREVQTLVSEVMPAGVHSTRFEAPTTLSSGIYYYRMQAGPFAQTKAMLLLR